MLNASRKKQPQVGDEDENGGDDKPMKRRRVKGPGKKNTEKSVPKSTSDAPAPANTATGSQPEASTEAVSADPVAAPKRKARTSPSDLKEAFDGKDG